MWLLYFLIGSFCFFFTALYKQSQSNLNRQLNKTIVKTKHFTVFIIGFICITVSSLRFPHEGTDTYSYMLLFQAIEKTNDLFSFNNEPGFLLFTKICSVFTSNFICYLFVVNTFLWISLYNFVCKYSSNVRYSLWLFLFLGYLDSSMCLIRQYLALAVLLYSYKYILKRNFIKFLLIVLIASTFHTTAIIFIISYFLIKINLKKNPIIIYTIICVITFVLTDFFYSLLDLIPLYKSYLTNSTFGVQDNIKLAPVLNFLILYIIIVFIIKHANNSIATLIIVGSLFTIFSFKFTQIGRITTYFSIYSIILLPNALNVIYDKRKKLFYTSFFFLLFLLRYIIIAYFRPEWTGVYPYKLNLL